MEFFHLIHPQTTAILLIDLQRDFLSPTGVLGRAGQDTGRMRAVVEPIKKLLAKARSVRIPIFFTQFIDSVKYRNAPGKHLFEKKELTEENLCCREGSPGAEFLDILPENDDTVVVKHNYDAFDGTNLEDILRKRGIQTLIVCGAKTNVCVESTIRTAYHKGFYVIVPKECVVTNTEREHQASLFNIDRYFGDVVSLQNILHAWD